MIGGGLPPSGSPVNNNGLEDCDLRIQNMRPSGGIVALGYVRREVPADAVLGLGALPVRQA